MLTSACSSLLKLRTGIRSYPFLNDCIKRFRKPSVCDVCRYPPDPKPCFDINKMTIERGSSCHAKLIRSFLYTQYWPREPSVCSLWMPLNSSYLDLLTEKYSNSGDRFLAFERIKRTDERHLVGLSVANKVYPWAADELEEWAHYTASKPERYRMYLCAHCVRNPNLYKKYNVDYVYEIEVLATAAEVSGLGVGTALLKNAIAHGLDSRHPLMQVIAVSHYTAKICEKCGMKREWSMNYSDFVDAAGQRVFFPRGPHHTVSIYTMKYDPKMARGEVCKPPYM